MSLLGAVMPSLSQALLDSAILIRVSSVGYAQAPEFELEAPDQPSMGERINYALQAETVFLEAIEAEERKNINVREKDGRKTWVPARRSISRRMWRGLEILIAKM